MKKLLFALCALAAISLLAPSAGFAQWENRIGIYTTATADAAFIDPAPAGFSQFTIYFIVTNPTNGSGTPLNSVKGWEYNVTIVGAAGGLVRLSDNLPAGIVNVGDASQAYNSTYLLGLAAALPVTNSACVLHSWTMLMINNAAPYNFYLNPATPPSFAGRLAILDSANTTIPADASQDDFADAVFAVGAVTTGIESETFGGVKALFR